MGKEKKMSLSALLRIELYMILSYLLLLYIAWLTRKTGMSGLKMGIIMAWGLISVLVLLWCDKQIRRNFFIWQNGIWKPWKVSLGILCFLFGLGIVQICVGRDMGSYVILVGVFLYMAAELVHQIRLSDEYDLEEYDSIGWFLSDYPEMEQKMSKRRLEALRKKGN